MTFTGSRRGIPLKTGFSRARKSEEHGKTSRSALLNCESDPPSNESFDPKDSPCKIAVATDIFSAYIRITIYLLFARSRMLF
jgi:hypothetical protein